jgi:D-serine deaminase-like pyridoxal phosphate-dependent protein
MVDHAILLDHCLVVTKAYQDHARHCKQCRDMGILPRVCEYLRVRKKKSGVTANNVDNLHGFSDQVRAMEKRMMPDINNA